MATRAKPPFPQPRERPPLGFYPDEQGVYDAILAKPYAALDANDCQFLVGEHLFVPETMLRYYAPALAEHATACCANEHAFDFCERLVLALVKAAPLVDARALAEPLRAAIHARPSRPPSADAGLDVPGPIDGHFHAAHGEARLLHHLLELDGASAGNRLLLESDVPGAQLTMIDVTRGVLEGGWTFDHPAAAELFTLDAIVPRLERAKTSPDLCVVLAAHYALGERPPDDIPSCGDPDCHVHARRRVQ